jgi:hypothetical protein
MDAEYHKISQIDAFSADTEVLNKSDRHMVLEIDVIFIGNSAKRSSLPNLNFDPNRQRQSQTPGNSPKRNLIPFNQNSIEKEDAIHESLINPDPLFEEEYVPNT